MRIRVQTETHMLMFCLGLSPQSTLNRGTSSWRRDTLTGKWGQCDATEISYKSKNSKKIANLLLGQTGSDGSDFYWEQARE